MTYLFGDSSPSNLESNFLAFLGDGLDFCVHVLLADERIKRGREETGERERAAAAEVKQLESLAVTVKRTAELTAKGAVTSSVERYAQAIVGEVDKLLRTEVANVQSALEDHQNRLHAQERAEREGCAKALEAMLLRHDPPETTWSLHLERAVDGSYMAQLSGATTFGLKWALELDIPQDHAFGRVVRVDRLVTQLEVHAPEAGGWLRKEVKIRPVRLDRYFMTELLLSPRQMTVRLRLSPEGEGSGFDLHIRPEAPHVRLVRAAAGHDEEPFEADESDAEQIRLLRDKLLAAAEEIAPCRKRLLEATLDEAPFADHSDPKSLVERLVAAMAPIVQQITRHSLVPNELVLKRLLGD